MASPSHKVTTTHYVDSQLRKFLKYTTRLTEQDKLTRKVNKIHNNVLNSQVLQDLKRRIESVIQDLEGSAYLVLKDKRTVAELVAKQKPADFFGCQPILFIEEFGPKITSLEQMCRTNHKILKDLETGLHLYFDHSDPLLSAVQALNKRSKGVSKNALEISNQFSRYNSRINAELLWISEFPKTLEMCSEQLTISMQTILDLQESLFQKSQVMDDLVCCKDASQDFRSQFGNLHNLLRTLEATELMSRSSIAVMQAVADLSSHCKNVSSIYQEKLIISVGFIGCEKLVKQKIPKLEISLNELHLEVNKARELYDEKFRRLTKDVLLPDKELYVFKVAGPSDISWRIREFNNMNISPSIRTQGRGQCAYVSTVSCTESQYKREYAVFARSGSNEAEEFTLKLSPDHLEDLVTAFRKTNSRKGCNTLDYCLERMQAQGVVTEEAYDGAKENFDSFQRYRIKGFEDLSKANTIDVKEKIKQGTALIGNFRITTDYYRLGPDDIYNIPKDAVYETNIMGQVCSHCVVILGYGVTPEGVSYYIFQNSYGPLWGKDGFGRIACDCLKHLYCPSL